MALTCARCGTQNPDGNRFCMSCGTPIAPVAAQVPVGAGVGAQYGPPPAPAPAAPAPQYAPPPGYPTPYYTPPPGGMAPQVHRTPWVVIISIVVGVVLVFGGVGTVLAFTLGSHSTTQGSTFTALSSPSPASTPSPGQTPSPTTPSPAAGQSVSTSSLTVVVPAGWQVLNKDSTSVSLQSPDGDGSLAVASGQSSPPQSAQQLKDAIDKALVQRYPDAAPCPNTTSDTGAVSGVEGIFWMMCFTATSGGQSLAIAEPLWVGANAGGSVAYVVVLQTTQDNTDAFVKKCVPILQSGITWTLK